MNKEDYDEEEEEEEGAGTAEGVLIAPPVFKDDDETEVRQNGLVRDFCFLQSCLNPDHRGLGKHCEVEVFSRKSRFLYNSFC